MEMPRETRRRHGSLGLINIMPGILVTVTRIATIESGHLHRGCPNLDSQEIKGLDLLWGALPCSGRRKDVTPSTGSSDPVI